MDTTELDLGLISMCWILKMLLRTTVTLTLKKLVLHGSFDLRNPQKCRNKIRDNENFRTES